MKDSVKNLVEALDDTFVSSMVADAASLPDDESVVIKVGDKIVAMCELRHLRALNAAVEAVVTQG